MAIEDPIEAKETVIQSTEKYKGVIQSTEKYKGVIQSTEKYKVRIENVNGWYGTKRAIKDINLNVKEKTVTAFIGPSGCGKTTLIRCLNRMHEMTPGAHVD